MVDVKALLPFLCLITFGNKVKRKVTNPLRLMLTSLQERHLREASICRGGGKGFCLLPFLANPFKINKYMGLVFTSKAC